MSLWGVGVVIKLSLYSLVLAQCLTHMALIIIWGMNEWINHQAKFDQMHKKRTEIVQIKSNYQKLLQVKLNATGM